MVNLDAAILYELKTMHATKGEFTQYPFFVRFRPFFYVFISP